MTHSVNIVAPINVLVLDDNKIVRTSFKTQFDNYKDIDFNVYLAENIAEAKLIVDSNKIDFAIVDLHLPDGKGEEFIEYANDIKHIVLSSSEDLDRRETLFHTGIVDYFSKENPLTFVFKEVVKNITSYTKNGSINVLLSCDEPNSNTKKIFEAKNYNVIQIDSKADLITELCSEDISLLILDIKSDYDRCRKILFDVRAKLEYQSTPIFVISDIKDSSKEALLLKNGADEYIHKDSSIEHLLIKAERAMESYITHAELNILTDSLESLLEKDDNNELKKEIRYRTKELQQAQIYYL